jgi:hypothetical protein
MTAAGIGEQRPAGSSTYIAIPALLQIRHPLSQSLTRSPAIYPLQHSLVPLTTTMADTSDPACSCSVHLAPFGALHEPRQRHAPPAPMAACRLGPPPISQAIGHKARNTHHDTNTPSPRSRLYRNVLLPTPAPPPGVRANKVKVCTLAAKCSCVQRSRSTLAVHVPLSAAVNDASCVRWEEEGMSRVP